MAQAPVEYLLRGIGDTMAKYYEAAIASRGRKLQHRDGMGIALSRMCLDPLYAYGEQAVADNRRHVVSPAFEEVILAIVMTRGDLRERGGHPARLPRDGEEAGCAHHALQGHTGHAA